jgi:hypothetical protein
VFTPGRRPRADDIATLAMKEGRFSVSHRPAHDHWLELLINGLTYDLKGLSPGKPDAPPPVAHRFGVGPEIGEALALAPGPHLSAGRAMPPVIRGSVAIAAELAKLPGVEAVCWHPARSAVAPAAFTRSVESWLGGGAFPALGLTSLYFSPDGRTWSEGLKLFIGQELCLDEGEGSQSDAIKLAVRLIDRLVGHGPLLRPLTWGLDSTAEVRLEPAAAGDLIRAWRRNA